MAGAHEQTGLREPTHGTAQMRAVDCKNLKLITLDAANPAGRVHGPAIGWHHVGIPESSEARLAFGKFAGAAKRHPGKISVVAAACNRREQESHDRHCDCDRHQAVEEYPDLRE